MHTQQQVSEVMLQSAVNWNINQREHAKSTRDRRHFQQNIDRLNAQLFALNANTVH